jgi:zinc protease
VLVTGPVDHDATVALIEKRFGGWRGATGAEVEIAPPAPPDGPAVLVVDLPELTQAQLRVVSAGFPRSSPDHAAGLLAGAVLGGGFTSRLMEAIRVQRGLSYGVRSRFACSRSGGLFHLSSFTKVETAGELVRVALDEVARFRADGPLPDELERTTAWLCGLHPLGLETHDQWAERLAEVELFGLPPETISNFPERMSAVTVERCHEVARRWLPAERRVVVAVGPARALAPQLEPFGEVRVVAARTVI